VPPEIFKVRKSESGSKRRVGNESAWGGISAFLVLPHSFPPIPDASVVAMSVGGGRSVK
jgi:hypothetical protein